MSRFKFRRTQSPPPSESDSESDSPPADSEDDYFKHHHDDCQRHGHCQIKFQDADGLGASLSVSDRSLGGPLDSESDSELTPGRAESPTVTHDAAARPAADVVALAAVSPKPRTCDTDSSDAGWTPLRLRPEFAGILPQVARARASMVTVTPREPRYPFDGPRNCRDKRRLRASPFVTSPHSFDLSCHDSDSDSDSESESAAKVRVGQGHESGGSLGPADSEFIFNGSL